MTTPNPASNQHLFVNTQPKGIFGSYTQIYCQDCGIVVYDNSQSEIKQQELAKNRQLECKS